MNIPDTFNGKTIRFVWDYRNAQGEIIGHVARFDGDGKKDIVPFFKKDGQGFAMGAADEPRPMYGLEVLAQADPARAVFIVEGEKAAAALQSLGLVAVSSQGGSNAAAKADWNPLKDRQKIILMPDNDDPGESYAKTIAGILSRFDIPPKMLIVRLPNLPEAGDVVDWISARMEEAFLDWDEFEPVPDVALKSELQRVVKDHAKSIPSDWIDLPVEQACEWPAPISLEVAPLPQWPKDVFPDAVQDFVTALSVSTETPPELASLMVLSAISAAAQGKFRVQIKKDYSEPINVWTICALPPASRKTAVQAAVTSPLDAWEKRQREIMDPEIKKARADRATLMEKIAQLRKQAGKAQGHEFESLKDEIANLESELPEIPSEPQIRTQDVTPENLGTIMSNNNERMSVLSDEGGIFDILAGRYSGGALNLDLFLQGHASSPVRVNRGSRPPISMNSPSLTIGLDEAASAEKCASLS